MRITTNNGTTISGSLSEVLATLTHLGVKAPSTNPVTTVNVSGTMVTKADDVDKFAQSIIAKLHAGEKVTPAPEATPKLTRDGVIQQAIDDVKALLSRNHTDSPWRDAESNQIASNLRRDLWFSTENQGFIVNHAVDFVVNADKRTVVAIVAHKRSREEISKGRAKCAPGDVFNEHIGKAIALRRALGLAVPVEYYEVEARDSDDLAVGDVVRGNLTGSFYELTKSTDNQKPYCVVKAPGYNSAGKVDFGTTYSTTLINDSARHTAPDLAVSRIIRH